MQSVEVTFMCDKFEMSITLELIKIRQNDCHRWKGQTLKWWVI